MTRRALAARERGFTLLEVMISLAILFGSLVVLLRVSTQNVWASQRAKFLTAATNLARLKMLDLEEQLLHEGFQEMSEELDGDFSEEGYPKFKWSAKIEKVELPSLAQLQAAGSEAQGGDKAAIGSNLSATIGAAGGGSASGAAGAALIQSQFQVIAGVLEASIRKVTLRVEWKVGGDEEHMVVVCYFTDPKAVDAAIGAAGLGGGPPAGGSDGGGGSGGGGSRGGTR